VVAVAVGNALSRFLEILERNEGYNKISIEHKWPNDILFEGRKGAGILLESSGGQMPEWVVIGVGVNLGEAPVLNDGTLAGTLLPGGDQVSQETRLLWRDRVAGFMREEWELARHRWQEEGFEVIRQKWLEGAVGRGKPLMARLPTGEISGKFLDIDALGRLCLELPSGEVEKISSADIFLI
jgi:BirA family biotin operon repressor/biotin-[acetyl-CoA-carboxylase] ligase